MHPSWITSLKQSPGLSESAISPPARPLVSSHYFGLESHSSPSPALTTDHVKPHSQTSRDPPKPKTRPNPRVWTDQTTAGEKDRKALWSPSASLLQGSDTVFSWLSAWTGKTSITWQSGKLSDAHVHDQWKKLYVGTRVLFLHIQ